MTKKILVPLDGSPLSERAIAYAESVAQRWQSELVLLRSVETVPSAALMMAEAAGEFSSDVEVYLRKHADEINAHGLKAITRIAYGTPADGIIQTAKDEQVDLILMATHGRTGLGRLVFGSVAEAVLRHTPVPLLLVRSWDESAAPAAISGHPHVLVPLDGSAFAEQALPTAANMAMALGGKLILLHSVSPFESAAIPAFTTLEPPQEQADHLAIAKHYLQDLVVRGVTSGCQVEFDVRLDVPTLAIAEAARDHNAALVVMATHGRGALGRMVLGSVADATLKHTRVPLLLVRPQGMADDTKAERKAP